MADKQAWDWVVALCLRWLSCSDPRYSLYVIMSAKSNIHILQFQAIGLPFSLPYWLCGTDPYDSPAGDVISIEEVFGYIGV